MTAHAARYEFRMQIRRPVLWIVYGLTFVATSPPGSAVPDAGPGPGERADPEGGHGLAACLLMTLLTIVYGCLLADRLVRDRRLGVAGSWTRTPAGRTGRLIGKYLGACAATAVPLVLAYFGRAVAYAVTGEQPAALGWAVAPS